MSRRVGWALALVTTALVVGILARADRYADGDMGHLIAVEIRLAQLLRGGDFALAARLWWALIAPQPPVGYLPGIAAFTLLGFRAIVAPVTMGLGLLICWDALARLWDRRAWMAWAPLVASPLVWLGVEQHGRDLLAGAALLQALAWLHASEGFTRRRASVAFGVWLGVGFMTKYTFPIFAVLPCLVAGGALLVRPTREGWKNLCFGVLGVLGPAGAWYAVRGVAVLQYVGFSFGEHMAANTANLRDPYTLASLAYYPLALRDALSLPGLVLVGIGAVVGLARGGPALLCLAAALGGLGVLSTVPEAIDRYALPAFLALVALVPALGAGRLAALAVLAVFLPQAVATGTRFIPGAPVVSASYDHPLSSLGDLAWPSPATYRPSDLDTAAWRVAEGVAALRAAQGRDDGTIGILGGRGPGSGPTFATLLIHAARAGHRYDFATVNTRPGPGAPDVFVGPLFDGTYPTATFSTLYVVRPKNADPAIDGWLGRRAVQETARIEGPDGARTLVYRVRP